VERLNEGLAAGRKLALISASAGFGKTTLISEWVAGSGRQAAWLSLDEGDSDPVRFLTYLVAALQTIAPKMGEGVLEAIQSPQPPPIEPILTALINEINTLQGDPSTGSGASFILVLDDYHLIGAGPISASTSIDNALAFLIEHLPPQMHLVITTREDPSLPLPRLRAEANWSNCAPWTCALPPPKPPSFSTR